MNRTKPHTNLFKVYTSVSCVFVSVISALLIVG